MVDKITRIESVDLGLKSSRNGCINKKNLSEPNFREK